MVPLDGSTFAEAALPIAFGLARRDGATVHLVRVHEPPTPVAGPEGPAMYDPEIDEDLERKGRRYLGVMLAWTNGDDRARAVTAYLHGPATECLSTYVQENAIDLVVMTTHARGGVSRALLGSVADGLVRYSLAPVLLVRPRHEAALAPATAPVFRRVLLPVDGRTCGGPDDRARGRCRGGTRHRVHAAPGGHGRCGLGPRGTAPPRRGPRVARAARHGAGDARH